jgi:uncharacterized membrane protein
LLLARSLFTLAEQVAMRDSRLPIIIFILMATGAVIYFALLYPQLPQQMASHFNASGRPTAWMPKSVFFFFFPGVCLFVLMMTLLVPKFIASKPNDKINLPNKEYWLAPERRSQSFQFLETYLAWFGCALLALLISGFYFSLTANLRDDRTFDSNSFYVVLGAFLAFTIVWMVRMTAHFKNAPSTSSQT